MGGYYVTFLLHLHFTFTGYPQLYVQYMPCTGYNTGNRWDLSKLILNYHFSWNVFYTLLCRTMQVSTQYGFSMVCQYCPNTEISVEKTFIVSNTYGSTNTVIHLAANCKVSDQIRACWRYGKKDHSTVESTSTPQCYLYAIKNEERQNNHLPRTMRCLRPPRRGNLKNVSGSRSSPMKMSKAEEPVARHLCVAEDDAQILIMWKRWQNPSWRK